MPTKEQIAIAFTVWERRFREDPSRFASEQEKLALDCPTYGELCAAYLLELIKENAS